MEIGEVRRGKEIGYKGYYKYIWAACEYCGKKRWVHLVNNEPRNRRCHSCACLGEEMRGKLSKVTSGKRNPMFGKHHSEETKKQISAAKIGKPVAYITGHADFNGDKNPFWGKHHCEKTKAKVRLANKGNKYRLGQTVTQETRNLISVKAKQRFANGFKSWLTGKTMPMQARQGISQRAKARYKDIRNHPSYGRKLTPEHKAKLSRLGWRHSAESKEKMREISIRNWQDTEFVKKVILGLNVKPNKLEKRLMEICEKHKLPYVFNAASADLIIGRHIPDFVNVNGKKEVVEVFGERWHDPSVNPNIHPRRTKEATLEHYREYGFNCIIIWEKEILSNNAEEIVLSKLAGGSK